MIVKLFSFEDCEVVEMEKLIIAFLSCLNTSNGLYYNNYILMLEK